jgi:carboxylesterase type B
MLTHSTLQAPKPITDAWKGTKKATAFGSSCPQFNFVIKKLENDEDCLFLNIYTPESKVRGGTAASLVRF